MRETLMEHTRKLLRESPQSIPEVYHGMSMQGSEVSYYWLRKFSAGNVSDPSVNKVQELYEYLTGKPLITPTVL